MKKNVKKPLIVIFIVIAALICAAFTGLYIMGEKGFFPTIGAYVRSNKGDDMIITDSGPIIMSNQTWNENVFSDLQTGDKILIVNSAVAMSYPGATGCYFCMRLGGGADIPEKHLTELRELGWLS